MLNSFQRLKIIQSFEKGQNNKMATNLTKNQLKNHARFFIKWYAILNSALGSLKQIVLIITYVFLTN